jgi:hypothetical protein
MLRPLPPTVTELYGAMPVVEPIAQPAVVHLAARKRPKTLSVLRIVAPFPLNTDKHRTIPAHTMGSYRPQHKVERVNTPGISGPWTT